MKVRSGWGSVQMVRPIPLITAEAVLRHRGNIAEMVVVLVANAKLVLLLR